MKSIKTSMSSRLAALLVGAALFGLTTQSALAAGTTSGVTISNSATLAYSVGGVGQTDITSAAATFLVDERINLTVAGGVTTNVVPGSTAQATAFTVTNNSNSALDFNLTVTSVIGGDNFDPTACTAIVENGLAIGYQSSGPNQDTGTFIDELGNEASVTVYAVCDIPGTATNTQTGLVGLTATGRGTFNAAGYVATPAAVGAALTQTVGANTANVDILFGDIAGTEAGDVARDANHSARNTYSVVTAALSVTKTATLLCDPFNGIGADRKNIPGAMTQWSIAISNTGAAAATLTTITDALQVAALTIDQGAAAALTVPTNAATCVAGPGTLGFMVTASAARNIGGTPAVTTGYFTTANDADGVEFLTPNVTATFATVLPVDGGHATAGLLNAGETVTVTFNTLVQ